MGIVNFALQVNGVWLIFMVGYCWKILRRKSFAAQNILSRRDLSLIEWWTAECLNGNSPPKVGGVSEIQKIFDGVVF